jgi:hypothetical protein
MRKFAVIALCAASLGLSACASRYYYEDRYAYHEPRGYYYGDRDRDGIPNRYDRDRDNDGVPNYDDRAPSNPYRN